MKGRGIVKVDTKGVGGVVDQIGDGAVSLAGAR